MPTATDRAPGVEYKNTKGISADFAKEVNAAWIKEKFGEGRFGFGYYDKEQSKNIPLPELTFVVLDVYAGVSGYNDGNGERIWSNRAKDTRTDTLVVFSNLSNGQIAKGLYREIKSELPKGAKYTKFVKAYCIQLEKVVEIKLSGMVEKAMQKAVALTESKEEKRKRWDKVFILGLADNDHLWGFHLKGHTTVDIKGNEYKNEGDLFFSPVFHCGVVNPDKQPDLHKICVEAQNAERVLHEQYKAKYAAQVVEEAPPSESAPANADVTDEYFPPAPPEDLPF